MGAYCIPQQSVPAVNYNYFPKHAPCCNLNITGSKFQPLAISLFYQAG